MTDAQHQITSFWNAVAPGYEAHDGNVAAYGTPDYASWLATLRDLLPADPADVLDVATGTGYVALAAAALGHRVVGVDLSDAMLDEARATAAVRDVPALFIPGDAVAPPFDPGRFDVIVCRHLLWTLRDPLRAFDHWHTLLRPGGRVVAIDGFWFLEGSTPPFFDEHYTPATRATLPFMHIDSVEPVVAALSEVFATCTVASSESATYTVVATV